MATVLEFNAALLPRGPFDLSASYEPLNFVESGGSGYVCLQPCSGIPVTNAAYWFKFVHKGDPGTPFTYADLTAEQKAELAHDATIAAQAAQAAAEEAAQKFTTLKQTIDAIDPQSTEGSIQILAAKQGVMEGDLAQLGHELGHTIEFNPEIERGMISNSGNNTSSTTQLRTVGYINSPKIRVEIQTGKYRIYGYDANGFVLVEDGWRTASATIAKGGCTRYRLCFGRVGEPTITTAEYSDLGIHIYDAVDRRTVALRTDIEDSCESSDPTKILSAKQGKILAEGLQSATTLANNAATTVGGIDTELHGADGNLLDGLTPSTGYYYSSSSNSVTSVSNESSLYYPQIDISEFVGKTIVLTNSTTAAGTRLMAITKSNGSILSSYSESYFKSNSNQVSLVIPSNAKYLYVSYKSGSTVTAKVLQATPATFYTKSEVDSMLSGIASEIAYVSTSGSDSNDGTLANPLATIQEAVKKAKVVMLLGGSYEQGQIDLSLACSKNVTITTQKDSRVILFGGTKILESDGTAHGTYTDVKVAALSGYSDTKHWIYQFGVKDETTEIQASDLTAYHKRRSHRCEHTCLARVGSVQAVSESDVPAFYYDGDNSTLYYKTSTAVSSSNFLFIPNGTLFANTDNCQIAMNGIDVVGKSINLIGVFNSTIADCSAGYSLGNGAFIIKDCKNLILRRCEALRNENGVGDTTGDGFNAHSTSVNLSKILNVFTTFSLIDCWSHDNYNDGYSDHEGCVGNIYGGLYEYNCLGGHGAGLTPALGASDTIIGAIAQGNLYDGVQLHSSGIDQSNNDYGTLYVEGCISRNNTRDGFIFTQSSNSGDFVNCMAYGNGRYGFYNYSSSQMRLINCKAGDNGSTDITSGCVKILCD